MNAIVKVADSSHLKFCAEISEMIENAAQKRGTGIAKRSPDYLEKKISEGKAVIALSNEAVAGFCYIETWGHGKYVANSGLIVHPSFRNTGLARKIKTRIFQLSRSKFPQAKIFGITTSLAVMKINSDLGYKPVTFSELTSDETFWKGCESCPNHDILVRTGRKHCLCTGMLLDPQSLPANTTTRQERWRRFRRFLKLRAIRIKRNLKPVNA